MASLAILTNLLSHTDMHMLRYYAALDILIWFSFLGACLEYGCLMYEYMENGSLDDRLFKNNKSTPLSWRIRCTIAVETATTPLFFIEGSLNHLWIIVITPIFTIMQLIIILSLLITTCLLLLTINIILNGSLTISNKLN